jgi:protocatechuate 3,4-dioxygenase beta subunit
MAKPEGRAGRDSAFFEEERSAAIVNGRMGEKASPRLAAIMAVVVRHLHAAVKEAQITSEEWLRAVQFLTETGHKCTAWRQEFILLSDVLGVSMLVDAINHQRPPGSTENTVLGPFYVADAPRLEMGANVCLDGKGEPLVVRGRVLDTAGRPISGATLDVWQANQDGFYDVQEPGIQPDFNLRGLFQTGENGEYWFRSIKPHWYRIPDDGPVGSLLHALDRHPIRAAHLHFIVSAPGFDNVVTHIFTPDCPFLPEDAVFGVKSSLIAEFDRVDDSAQAAALGFESPFWMVRWDFVLARKEQLARATS